MRSTVAVSEAGVLIADCKTQINLVQLLTKLISDCLELITVECGIVFCRVKNLSLKYKALLNHVIAFNRLLNFFIAFVIVVRYKILPIDI